VAARCKSITAVDDLHVALTYECLLCGQDNIITVDAGRFWLWYRQRDSPLVQQVFPELSAAEREILVSGSHGECFNATFPSDEE
jgi:hypothetical protein